MSTLAQTQARFCAGLDPFAANEVHDAGVQLVRAYGGMDGAARLDVYRRNVSGAHVAVLEQVYPACRSVLGDRAFGALAREYTWREPGNDADLNRYGETWPAFAVARVENHDYLLDLGQLEFAWNQIWFAADDPIFDFDAFGALAAHPERLLLETSKSLHLVRSDWPVMAIWQQQHRADSTDKPETKATPSFVALSRKAGIPQMAAIDEPTYALLDAVMDGLTLAELEAEETTSPALGKLAEMISSGWLCGARDRDDV